MWIIQLIIALFFLALIVKNPEILSGLLGAMGDVIRLIRELINEIINSIN